MPKFVDRVCMAVCAVSLMVMMSIGAIDIISGEIFNVFLPFKVEVSGYLFVIVVFLSLPLVAARSENIVVDIVSSNFRGRLKSLSEVASLLVTLGVFCLYTYGAVMIFRFSWEIGEKSYGYLPIPIYLVKLTASIGFGLAALVTAGQLVRRIRDMTRSPEVARGGPGAAGGDQ